MNLPTELWIEVAEQDGLSKEDISSLTCINKLARSSLVFWVFNTLIFEACKRDYCTAYQNVCYINSLTELQHRIQCLSKSPHLICHTRHLDLRNWVNFPDTMNARTKITFGGRTYKYKHVLELWKSTYAALAELVASFPSLRTITFIENRPLRTPREWSDSPDLSLLCLDPLSLIGRWNQFGPGCFALKIDLPHSGRYRFRLPDLSPPSYPETETTRLKQVYTYFQNISQCDTIIIEAAVRDAQYWTSFAPPHLGIFYPVRYLITSDCLNSSALNQDVPTVQHMLDHFSNIRMLGVAESLTFEISATALPKLQCVTANYDVIAEILCHWAPEAIRIKTGHCSIHPLHRERAALVSRLDVSDYGWLSRQHLVTLSAVFPNLTHLTLSSLSIRSWTPRPLDNRDYPLWEKMFLMFLTDLDLTSRFPHLRILSLLDTGMVPFPITSRGPACLGEIHLVCERCKFIWMPSVGWCSRAMEVLDIDEAPFPDEPSCLAEEPRKKKFKMDFLSRLFRKI